MKLYAYNQASKSAKALADALGIKRIKHEGKPLQIRGGLINWGSSQFKRSIAHDGVLNFPDCVAVASNKLETFKALTGLVSIPEWTEERVEAQEWLAEGVTVVARTLLNGHSGAGIFICTKDDEVAMPAAALFVKYIPKKAEYRIHVFNGEAFFIQRKARNKDVADDDVNWKVRNHQNGFIYAHIDVEVADVAKTEAINAVAALGLDFGAVDLIYNEKQDKYYVLEVNTACGLEGTTLDKYVEQFKKYL